MKYGPERGFAIRKMRTHPHSANRRGSRAGFSLLEVMIALVVITFSMMAILTMVIQASTVQQSARETAAAKEATMAQIAKIKMGAFNAVSGFQGTTFIVEGLPDPRQSDRKARGSVTIDSSNSEVLEILVSVSWKGSKGDTTYSMRSLCAR